MQSQIFSRGLSCVKYIKINKLARKNKNTVKYYLGFLFCFGSQLSPWKRNAVIILSTLYPQSSKYSPKLSINMLHLAYEDLGL